jgi:hypothetical protein
MNQYRECERCGASLDPGEKCDCVISENTQPALLCSQPPVITENLDSIRHGLQLLLTDISTLPRNDDALKYVKQVRANLSKEFAKMESERKAVKQQVMEPYLQAEEKYKSYIANPYKEADEQLKEWVDSYQNDLKEKCAAVLKEYFDELCQAYDIDFLSFDSLGIVVDMTMARQKEPRKAMEQIYQCLSAVREDMDSILKMENAAELMAEYRKNPVLSAAMLTVEKRKQEQQQMQHFVAEQNNRLEQGQANRTAIMEAAPEIVQEQGERFTVAFMATGSIASLKAMKAYGISLGITFEDITQEDENNG